MPDTITIRIDPKVRRAIERIARERAVTKSDVVRAALAQLAEAESNANANEPPQLARSRAVGCASGGPPDLSERTGAKFREQLVARRGRAR